MSDYPRRINAIALLARIADARQLLLTELLSNGQPVRSSEDIFLARLANNLAPTVLVAHGLSGVLTEEQWQQLQSVRSRVPLAWRTSLFVAQGPTSDNPDHLPFWEWAATLGFVPLVETEEQPGLMRRAMDAVVGLFR